jgi:hypothetical protein
MDFDQMMDAWRTQDEAPLYGVNRDLLQLVLRHEQADVRRALRLEQWVTYIAGPGMAALAAFWLWATIYRGDSLPYLAAASVSAGAFILWIVAFWMSRRRQALRERSFGNSLLAEVRRSLSLVDYQLSTAGRWSAAMLWAAPPMLGAMLIYWLMAEINDNTGFWFDAGMTIFILGTAAWTTWEASRKIARQLEPRRQRLSELLALLGPED